MAFRRSSRSSRREYKGQNRFEHWYRDNQVYFITARCRDRYPAFAHDDAKAVFWDRLTHFTTQEQFTLWVATLLDNHYHLIGYCKRGERLGPMMRKIHGSTAKRVNDLLPARHKPFWRDAGSSENYFDGCLRDEKQCRLAYRYTLMQAVRAKLVCDWREYPHTRVWIDVDRGVKRALELNAFMEGVPYKRYERGHGH
jgi:REP element-mobilizing transposase RayT